MSDLARAKAILADLVAFPTISADSNLECIDYARGLLEPLGARIEVIPDATGRKANLLATIGPDKDGGVVLSGHVDVVPIAGQEWSYPAFRLTEAMDRLYGRGSCDMKGFVACALSLAPEFAAAPLARPVHIALTHDEEVGCLGAPNLIAALTARYRPAACIVGEPTEMGLVVGHKGCYEYTTHFEGLEGHGSRPERCVNAVEYAVLFIRELMDIARDLRARVPADPSPFDPPWTTVSIGSVAGGIAHNVVPNRCVVQWEFRPVSAADAAFVKGRILGYAEDELLPAMRATHAEAEILTEVIGEVAGLAPDPASPAAALAGRLTGRSDTGLVPFGTEAGLFQAAGIPTVVCGPGSIAEAHKPDEFIAEGELAACLAALDRLVPELAG